MRALSLHVSALSNREYSLFTTSFESLMASDAALTTNDDFETYPVTVHEAGIWLRGRYPDLSVTSCNKILRLVSQRPAQDTNLTRGQFFAILRVVLHVRGGAELDSSLVFRQAPQDDGANGVLGSPFKRRHLSDDSYSDEFLPIRPNDLALETMRRFWKSLWKDKEDPFLDVYVRRGPNPVDSVDVPATMKVLHLPAILSSIGDVMIRSDYDEAMRDIEGHSTCQTKSVVVAGHPGIGKTTLLYYILVKRLLEKQRTILQSDTQNLFFFTDNGVEVLRPFELVDPKSEKYQNTWALVDINIHVERPAEMLSRDTSPFFLVMASSSRASRLRGLQKYGRPSVFWLMKPFNLAEIIQARQLQRFIPEESDIENFFEKYGPSARDCYKSCKADALDQYDSKVRSKVKQMDWDLIMEILKSLPGDINTDEGPHEVLLIEPQSNDRAVSKTRVVTRNVCQLLWERDEQWRNYHQLSQVDISEQVQVDSFAPRVDGLTLDTRNSPGSQ